jgi:hypothetical protein
MRDWTAAGGENRTGNALGIVPTGQKAIQNRLFAFTLVT